MVFMEERGIAACGLGCAVCKEAPCAGCHAKGCAEADNCKILACTREKGYRGCWACDAFPCDNPMFARHRQRAFVRYAQRNGADALLTRLGENARQGIVYHREGLTGDYDAPKTEAGVLALLRFGRCADPYAQQPVLETDQLRLRPLRRTDAADMLACYSAPEARALLNADNCTGDFCFDTEAELLRCIDVWLDAYAKRHCVRCAIALRADDRALGTVEMFEGATVDRDFGILRLDIAPAYEREAYLTPLLARMTDAFPLLFGTRGIATLCPPAGAVRREVLQTLGYRPFPQIGREHYWIYRA